MATLYVTEPGARLEKEYGRLRIVDQEGKTLLVTPLARVSEVVLVGRAGATTPALLALLEADISLAFVTRQGQLLGRLTPPTGKNLALRRQQYQQADEPAFCLGLSQAIVAGKLRNCRTLARRMLRSGVEAPPGQIERLRASLKAVERLPLPIETGHQAEEFGGATAGHPEQHSPDQPLAQTQNPKSKTQTLKSELMGQEGRAAKAYFAIFRAALKPALPFGPRSRRPPRDPVNALLSLGYSLLTANLVTALEVVGLDPYCGFFHGPAAYGRPALALDLMEEFRPIIVDSVVLSLVNKGMLSAGDFERGGAGDGPGVYLNRRGRRVFFEQYARRLNTQVFHPAANRPLSYQKIFELQARQVAKLIQGQLDAYRPFLVK
jgi:CRISPR-associated protein Cas1